MSTPLRRVYDNVRAGQTVLRDVGRLRQIVSVLLRHGFGAVLQQLKLQDGWISSKLVELHGRGEVQLPLERRILLAIQDLGPTFIKLGQMLSTRGDLLPPALIAELQSLQDNVPPLPTAEIHAILQRELGDAVEVFFDDLSATPLATASIAQVHTARLKGSGVEVVVKVQRPNLEPQIASDLEIMSFLARAVEANFPEARMFSPAGMVAAFERSILKEIDFHNELDNLEHFRRNFQDVAGVHFPQPYAELSTARVLTMERIRGTKISQIAPPLDVETVLRTALNAVLQMIYLDGFFHGDVHPGNLLVREDGTVCFIDVGLCGRLTPRQRDQLTDLLIAVVRRDYAGVARLFWNMTEHSRESTPDFRTFEADVIERAEAWFAGATISDIEFSAIFKDLIEMSLRHRLRMPPDYTMTFKAVITMEGVGKQLRPDMDLLAEAQPFVTRIVAERYQPLRLLETGYAAVRELADNLGTLPETARVLLEDARAGRAQLNLEIPQLDALRRAYVQQQQRNVWAGLAATCAVCATLALPHGDAIVFGMPPLSVVLYAAAAGLAALYVTRGRR